MLNAEEFGQLFYGLRSEAFRAETLPAYNVLDEVESLERWRRGEPISEYETDSPWQELVRRLTARGVLFRRVRVIHGSPTEYQRYCIDWWYPHNEAAGEHMLYVDASKSTVGLPPQDFWLLDDTVVVMRYSEGYEFLGAEIAPKAELGRYTRFKNDLLGVAISTPEFLSSLV